MSRPQDSALLLAVELDGEGAHPAAWRRADHTPGHLLTPDRVRTLARRAENAGFTLATFDDALVPPGAGPAGRIGAVERAAFAAGPTACSGSPRSSRRRTPSRSTCPRSWRRGHAGTPSGLADRFAHFVRAGAVDGFNVSPYLTPDGLDDIVDRLVPALQDRGVYRTSYEGTTLREHLGLRPPHTQRASVRDAS